MPANLERLPPGLIGRHLATMLGEDPLAGPAWRVVSVADIGSTNDLAAQLGKCGAPEGTVVVADHQASGRGRLGRPWHSPSGAGLWCSVLLRPPLPPGALGPLTLVLAVGVRRALAAHGATASRIKWPNDLLCEGRKLGGILTEARGGTDTTPPDFVIAGVGVNVVSPRDGWPADLAATTTSLDHCAGGRQDPAAFAHTMLRQVGEVYKMYLKSGFAQLREEWLAHGEHLGNQVAVTGPLGTTQGRFSDVDSLGRLVLESLDGRLQLISAGDVSLRSAAQV